MKRRDLFKGLLALAVAPFLPKLQERALPGEVGTVASCDIAEETNVGSTIYWEGTNVPKAWSYTFKYANSKTGEEFDPFPSTSGVQVYRDRSDF